MMNFILWLHIFITSQIFDNLQSLILQCELTLSSPFQELADLRKSGLKTFRDIIVDEANILNWQGLIVPVGCLFL